MKCINKALCEPFSLALVSYVAGELLAPPAPLTNWEWMKQNTFPNGFLVFVLGRWALQKETPALAAGWLAGLATGRRPAGLSSHIFESIKI